ncbi:MAG: RNA methyltransferase [Alphaproteobacteria bacterium]|nr:RNA methyltransferase [Alphaproteobacteria bacterium]
MTRGYFGIGVEGISKPMNVGNLLRSAHAFGASFFFTGCPEVDVRAMQASDTSGAFDNIPFYNFEKPEDLLLPHQTSLVAVELLEDAVELPSFRHPKSAVYVLGPELGNVSPAMLARCDYSIKIPMKFCINVGVAGALVMYDRLLSMGRFADRPVHAGGPDRFSPQQLKKGQMVNHLARQCRTE